jgi:hypothetical protein
MDGFPSLNFRMSSINIADEPGDIPASLDSITLGQLRNMVGQQPRLKTQQYAMRYEDEDTVFDEIEEFYSYAEIRHVSGNLNAWQSSFHGGEHNPDTSRSLGSWPMCARMVEDPADAKEIPCRGSIGKS